MQFLGEVVFMPVDVSTTGSWSRQCRKLFGGAMVDVPVTGSDKFQQFVTNRAENRRFSACAVLGQGSRRARCGATTDVMVQTVR